MTDIIAISIVCFAALIHASFQLSISTLTLMSGHTIGFGRTHARLMSLLGGFNFGVATMTILLICTLGFILQQTIGTSIPPVAWAGVCGILFGVGLAVWLFYYRKDKGTTLWVPRHIANFLASRSKHTKSTAEAFALGLSTVLGELLFIIAPLGVAVLAILPLDPQLQLIAILLYTIISLAPLALVTILVSGGHKLSSIQKWRETNKHFLQFSAGSALCVLGFYLYVNYALLLPATGVSP